jgi:hypothetical protein
MGDAYLAEVKAIRMMLEMLEREQYDLNNVVLYVDCDQAFSTINTFWLFIIQIPKLLLFNKTNPGSQIHSHKHLRN